MNKKTTPVEKHEEKFTSLLKLKYPQEYYFRLRNMQANTESNGI